MQNIEDQTAPEDGKARQRGRPSAFRPEFVDRVIELGSEGMGRSEIAFELGVVRNTLVAWEQAHPDFLIAMEHAHEAAAAWWARQGRLGIWGGKDFNANAYRLQVTNRFPKDWRDRQEVEHSGAVGSYVIETPPEATDGRSWAETHGTAPERAP